MAKKRRVPPQDAMFLWTETPETMMHVASLMPFTPPEDAGPTYLRDVLEEARQQRIAAPWNMKLTHPFLLRHPRQAWVEDENFDFDFHVRRSALASPGDERELGMLVSRLHSHQLDFTRPPWELHVIEGLAGGRFALYTKVHHALVDGYSAVKMLGRALSEDPAEPGSFFFSLDPPKRSKPTKESASLVKSVAGTVTGVASGAVDAVTAAAGVAKAVTKLELSRGEEHKNLKGGWSAPDSILNQRISRSRRFATQQFETDRFTAIAKKTGATLNDVVMTVCGGGLRTYLEEVEALPDKALVAFVPVNIREEGDAGGGGNKVAVLMASMGTDVAEPAERLETVVDSTSRAKKQMAGMGQLPALAYSGYLLAPGAAQTLSAIAGVKNPLPTTFNLVLSNVPGPKKTLYFHGARLEAVYPVSIPAHGMALNITLETYADTMNFGFIGDREAVPHLQRLAVYTGEALTALEESLGLPAGPRGRADSGVTVPGADASKGSRKTGEGRSAATRAALSPSSAKKKKSGS